MKRGLAPGGPVPRKDELQERAQEALREGAELFESTFEYAAIGMALVGTDGRYLQVNRSLCEMVGRSEQELLAATFQAITHPDDLDMGLDYMRRMLAGEIQSCQFEKRYFHKLGHVVWGFLSFSLVRDATGSPLYFVSQVQDISERKRADEALAERENLLRTIIETEPQCVKLIAADGTLLEINRAGLDMIEADSLDQVVGGSIYSIVAPEYRQSFKALTERVFQGESGILEFEIVGIKGTRRWLEAQAVPLCNQKDEIIALLGITRDISERKRADEALRESEAQHRMLLEHYLDGVTLIVDEKIVYANPILCEMVGYSAEELFGRPCLELLVPEDRERVAQRIRELFAGALEYPSEYRMLKRDRGILPVEIASRVIQYDGQPALLCILRDITDRKRTEEALQAAREELEGRVERQMLRRNPYGLTFRELTVLNLVAGGKADKEIGFTLYISHLTAQKHVANILKKMGVACRTEAGVRAVREGLLE